MKLTCTVKNIVLVGIFNIADFDKYFFIKNELLAEEDILPNSFGSTIGATQVSTEAYTVVILTNQAVFTEVYSEKDDNRILEVAKRFINAIPSPTITAMGINLHWIAEDAQKSNISLSRDLFYNNQQPLFAKFFSEENCAYGAYLSKDYFDARLKLDVKPAQITKIRLNNTMLYDGMNFQFNYHFVTEKTNTKEKALKNLDNFYYYENGCKEILSIY